MLGGDVGELSRRGAVLTSATAGVVRSWVTVALRMQMRRAGSWQWRRGLGAGRRHAADVNCRCIVGAGGALSGVGDVVKIIGTFHGALVVGGCKILLKSVLDAASATRVRV